jgi:hypothetical protein
MSNIVQVLFSPDYVPFAAYAVVTLTKQTNTYNFVCKKDKSVGKATLPNG